MTAEINGKDLRKARVRVGLSREQLAKEAKVGIATIKRIERSDEAYHARPSVADRLASRLAVPTAKD